MTAATRGTVVAGRPEPVGTNERGITLYSPAAVKAFRMCAGVKQDEVAERLRITRNYVSVLENGGELQARQAMWLMDAVEAAVRDRNAIVADGIALAKSLEDGTYTPARSGKFIHAPEAAVERGLDLRPETVRVLQADIDARVRDAADR